MQRYERMAVGLAGLLVLGTAGARENPVSLAPFTILDALLGDGSQENGLINGVIIGGDPTGNSPHNTYPDMRWALSRLGFRGSNAASPQDFVGGQSPTVHTMPSVKHEGPHYNHFHIYLQPPRLEPIHSSNMLVAGDAAVLPAADAVMLASGPAATITPAIVRRVERAVRDTCTVSENPSYVEGREAWGGGMIPALWVLAKLKNTFGISPVGAVTTVVAQAPLHGRVAMIGLDDQSFPNATFEAFRYTPNGNFLGNDRVAFDVTVNGQKFRISYVIHVQRDINEDVCLPPGMDRGELEPDIQIVLDEAAPISDVSRDTDANALDAWRRAAALDAFLADASPNVTVTIEALDGSGIGRTQGTTITLDDNAADHGWFADATPGANEEFLPTSNPNEWAARPGSGAYGRMDMLSVLLHEYGHALGIEHSADPNDFMATTLAPGVTAHRHPVGQPLQVVAGAGRNPPAALHAGKAAAAIRATSASDPCDARWGQRWPDGIDGAAACARKGVRRCSDICK